MRMASDQSARAHAHAYFSRCGSDPRGCSHLRQPDVLQPTVCLQVCLGRGGERGGRRVAFGCAAATAQADQHPDQEYYDRQQAAEADADHGTG